uniref:Crumbs cell polarity complex component 1 n=1 Tax=Heterorhabditis bacteriophora TaxID=37862 RepID=A0A1I7X7T4_HETBA
MEAVVLIRLLVSRVPVLPVIEVFVVNISLITALIHLAETMRFVLTWALHTIVPVRLGSMAHIVSTIWTNVYWESVLNREQSALHFLVLTMAHVTILVVPSDVIVQVAGMESGACEQEKSSCDSRPCRNDGHCVNLVGDYFCVCPEGVSGKDCEVAPNRCLGEPCLNGGVCGDFGSRLECSCPKKFTGSGENLCNICDDTGCQYELDACAAGVCQNGGECTRTHGEFICKCQPGFSGNHCETNLDDCSASTCPLGGTCVDQINSAQCLCPFNMTGSNCDKAKLLFQTIDVDYDLHFFDSLRPSHASLAVPFLIQGNKITVSLWIKFSEPQSKGVVLTMYNSQQINYSSSLTEVLRVDSDGVYVSLISEEPALQLHFPFTQRINDGAWNHLPVFAGSVTRVHVWNRVLDFESEIPLMSVSCQGAERKIIHQPPIQVQNCPADQFVTTSLREVNISWPEPVFYSINPIEKVEKNLKQSQIFTWGEYDVFYVARDNSSNTAQCSFKLHISRDHCLPMEDPVNGVQACESWGPRLRYKACSITCREGFEFSRSPAVFYTCGADGEWRPRKHNKILFHYPQCTKSVPATRMIILRVFYPASSLCNEASRDALKSKLLASLNSINQKWNMCSLTDNSGCVGARISVDCSPDVHRSKRENHSFKVTIELPVKRNMVSDSASRQKLLVVDAIQNEILLYGAFNLEKVLPNGRPDLSTFELLDEFHCQSGQVAVNDVCVPCAPGSYHSLSTSQCELCAEGDYQPQPGRNECLHCPSGFITAGEGAISEQECKPKCPPGHFLNISTSLCTPCGLGFFQSRGGAFECIACGVGKTTLSERTTSEDECRDECLDGDQLSSSGTCQPCPIGSYRTRGEHKHCILCPPGTTTESISSTRREQCNTPRCTAGQFLIKETINLTIITYKVAQLRCEERFQPKSQRVALITVAIGYYYEDDDEYESKAVYVSGEEDNRELEQRMRLAQKHMYRPGINQAE